MPSLLEQYQKVHPKSRRKLKKEKSKKKILQKKPTAPKQDFLQFFLTEFDRNEDKLNGESDEELVTIEASDDDATIESGIRWEKSVEDLEKEFKDFHNLTNEFRQHFSQKNPNLRQSSRYLTDLIIQQQSLDRKPKKTFDFNDEKMQKIFQKHKEIVNRMEKEEKRRMVLLEKAKQQQKMKELQEEQRKLTEESAKQQKLKDLQKKIDEENIKKNQMMLKIKEMKKKKEEETNLLQREWQSMASEDFLTIGKKKKEQEEQEKQLKARLLSAKAKLKAQKEKETKVLSKVESEPVISKRPGVPRFAHPIHKVTEEEEEENRRKEEESAKKKELTAEERLQYHEVLAKRIKENMQQKVELQKQQELEQKEKKEKMEKFMKSYETGLAEKKLKLKQQEKEEKKKKKQQLLLQKSQSENQMKVAEDEEREENEEGEELVHAISSAPEDFTNIIEDFQFDEFMGKPLTQLYSDDSNRAKKEFFLIDAKEELDLDNHEDLEKEEFLHEEERNQGPPPEHESLKAVKQSSKKVQPLSKKIQNKKASNQSPEEKSYKINRSILKLPKNLKDTPYFKHYLKYMKEQEHVPVEALMKENKEKEIVMAVHQQSNVQNVKKAGKGYNHKLKKMVSDSKQRPEGIAAKEYQEKDDEMEYREEQNDREDEEEEEEQVDQDSLLELLQKAQEKKYFAQQGSNPTSSTFPQQQQPSPALHHLSPTEKEADSNPSHSKVPSPSNKPADLQIPTKFNPQLTIPTIPTLSSLLSCNQNPLPPPSSLSYHLSKQPLPPSLTSLSAIPAMENIQNIKNRYGISVDEFLPPASFSSMQFGGGGQGSGAHHLHAVKKLKSKKSKKETVSLNPQPQESKKIINNKAVGGKNRKAAENNNDSSPTSKNDNSLAYSHDTLSLKIPNNPNRVSQRYKTNQLTSLKSVNQNNNNGNNSANYDISAKNMNSKEYFSLHRNDEEEEEEDEENNRIDSSRSNQRLTSGEKNKIKQKISALHDYETQLQQDYEDLKSQFTQKLQTLQETNELRKSQEIIPTLQENKGEIKSQEREEGMEELRKSVTQSYIEQQKPKISVKDLLNEWAIEDAIENGEIQDDELIRMHQQNQDKYYQDEDYDDNEEYDEEEEDGNEQDEEEQRTLSVSQGNKQPKTLTYDDESYYDRRLFRGNKLQEDQEEEEGEEDQKSEEDDSRNPYEEEEDQEESEEQFFQKERTELLLKGGGQGEKKLNDQFCLDLLHNLSSKIKQK
jgi:hypothetical protein